MYVFIISRYFSPLPLLFFLFSLCESFAECFGTTHSHHFPVISLDWQKKNGVRLKYNGRLFLYMVSQPYTPDRKSKKVWTTIFSPQGNQHGMLYLLPIILPYPAFPKFLYSLEAAQKPHGQETDWSPQADLVPNAGICKDSIKDRSEASTHAPNTDI